MAAFSFTDVHAGQVRRRRFEGYVALSSTTNGRLKKAICTGFLELMSNIPTDDGFSLKVRKTVPAVKETMEGVFRPVYTTTAIRRDVIKRSIL